MVLANPFRKTMVCNLLSRISSTVRSKTSSKTAVSSRTPSFFKRVRSSSSILRRSSGAFPISERAIPLNFDSIVSCRQSSCLLRKPYCPKSFSSSCKTSARQGNLGVAYFFFCFFGSPVSLSSRSWFGNGFLLYSKSLAASSSGSCSLSAHLQAVSVAVSAP